MLPLPKGVDKGGVIGCAALCSCEKIKVMFSRIWSPLDWLKINCYRQNVLELNAVITAP